MKKVLSILLVSLVLTLTIMLVSCVDGKDGKDGVTPTIEISADGYWVINGEKTDVKATQEESVDANPQGLDFYKQDDGTYIVACGTAKYLSEIIIPATYLGKAVVGIDKAGFAECTTLVSVIIPDSVITIGESAFSNCTLLENVTIGTSVSEFGKNAFNNCNSLKNVYYEGDIEGWLNIDFADSESSSPMWCATNLYFDGNLVTDITIPSSITSISQSAFRNCTSIKSVIIPDGVTSIGHQAFMGCSSLTSIEIPNSVTSIGSYTFLGCSSLTNINIPNSVTSMGIWVFNDCNSLTNITIPNSLKSIGQGVLMQCTSLTTINFNGTIEQWKLLDKYIDSVFGGEYNWDSYTNSYTIYCTDGQIAKDGTVTYK